MAVDNHNQLALLIILKDFMGTVDFRMLVNQAVTGIVPDHFDRHIQLIFPAYTITQRRHFRATFNGIGPHKHRNAGLDRVFQGRHTDKR
ncbi:Uncharacterised protein [Shigella sonnei]|nr:Uncharacterised protein [Shigella sonnei]CSR53388.1 Uncharacterised protein [Shigella sonnei]